jgi:pilus assembly protein Flp/PilA
MRGLWEFLRRENGPTAVEYAILFALLVTICVASLWSLCQQGSAAFSYPDDYFPAP